MMAILIDGYNLLHATGYIAAGASYDSLEGPRRNFLQFLVERLTRDEAIGTTVVFDAANAPPGLPTQVSFGRIRVLFAHDHAEADDLIEELIQSDNVPQKLTVVSSDHRLHRAARRRRATVVDSDQWYWEIHDRPTVGETGQATGSGTGPGTGEAEACRNETLSDDEVASWVALFGEVDEAGFERQSKVANRKSATRPNSGLPDVPALQAANKKEPSSRRSYAARKEGRRISKKDPQAESTLPAGYGDDAIHEIGDGEDIFPPGYGDDLFEDDPLKDDLPKDDLPKDDDK